VLNAVAETQAATTVCRTRGRAAAERALDLVEESQDPPLGRRGAALPEDAGRPTVLRDLVLPRDPGEAAEMRAFYEDEVYEQQNRETDERNARIDAHQAALQDAKEHWQPGQFRRWLGVSAQIDGVAERPAVRAREAAMDRAYGRVGELQDEFWGAPGEADADGRYQRFVRSASLACSDAPDFPSCRSRELNAACRPALDATHTTWVARMAEAQEAAAAYVAAATAPMSGLAAQLKDPDAHALAVLQIEGLEAAVATFRRGSAQAWTAAVRLRRDDCVERPLPPDGPTAGAAPTVDTPGACPRLVKPINARLELGPVTMKVNCEEVELGGDVGVAGWMGLFGEIKYDARAGALTVFVGGQLGAGTEFGSAAFKSGMYVRVGDDGLRDAGWRVGPGMTAGYGPAEIELKDEIDISFVGAVSSTFGG
jgi:hypothetical protein